MPYNLPGSTLNNISFGPGKLYIGPTGATPTTDIGAISEDGINVEISSEKRDILQGNPKVIILTFTQMQSVMVKVTSIEYNQDNWTFALGAGNTTVSGTEETWAFGGDPFVTQIALQIEHAMAQSGHTLYMDVWKAQSNAGIAMPFTHDEHAFPFEWKAIQADNNWAGSALVATEQLIRVRRLTA